MERLSGLDAAFLYLETPTHHMHVAMTMVIDPATMPGGYSFDKVKEFIRSRLHVAPLFHRRLAEVPFRLNHPVWVEDENFDLDYHLRRIGAPAPGGRRELGELAGQIASRQLDRNRPLWEMWVIEGLKHGRVGIVTKVHHCAIDGASGADFLVHLFDIEPPTSEGFDEPVPLPSEHFPTDVELLGYAAASRFRRTMNLLPLVGRTAQSVARVVQGRRDPQKLTGAVPLTAPRTPWNGAVTQHRDVGLARVPLADLKTVKNAFGCTVNDVVLALVAGTLRTHLERTGDRPESALLAVCPMSVRDLPEGAGPSANRVSAMFVSLATDIDDVGDRIRAIRQSTKGAKEEHNAVGASMLMDWAEFAGPNVFNMAARLYSSLEIADHHPVVHNAIISNVPGPSFPLYYAGAELIAAYPLGPVMEGCGLNITVFSYRESVDIGFMVCPELVTDVWGMADAVDEALAELLAAAAAEEEWKATAPAAAVVGPAYAPATAAAEAEAEAEANEAAAETAAEAETETESDARAAATEPGATTSAAAAPPVPPAAKVQAHTA